MAGTIKKIRTPAQLRAIAKSQVGAEISGQVGPFQTQVKQYNTRRTRALSDMNNLWDRVSGYNTQMVGMLGNFNQQASENNRQAFEQANARLDQFRQQRAAEAQALAQQTGGPVPLSAFTEGIDPGSIGPQAAAGALMGAIGAGTDQLGDIGRTTAEVFPMVAAEERKKLEQDYEDKISGVQDEIANLKGQRGGLVNKRYTDLLAAERDYQIAGGTLGLNKRQLKASVRQNKATNALSWAQLNQQAKQNDAAGRLAREELRQRQHEFNARIRAAGGTAGQTAQDAADQMLYAIAEPGANKDYKQVSYKGVGFMSPRQAAKKGYFLLPTDKRVGVKSENKGMRFYYQQKTGTRTLPGNLQPIGPGYNDPVTGKPYGAKAYDDAYSYMVSHGVDPTRAAKTVRRYWNLGSSWTPPKRKK